MLSGDGGYRNIPFLTPVNPYHGTVSGSFHVPNFPRGSCTFGSVPGTCWNRAAAVSTNGMNTFHPTQAAAGQSSGPAAPLLQGQRTSSPTAETFWGWLGDPTVPLGSKGDLLAKGQVRSWARTPAEWLASGIQREFVYLQRQKCNWTSPGNLSN